jgi:hypothetical protein
LTEGLAYGKLPVAKHQAEKPSSEGFFVSEQLLTPKYAHLEYQVLHELNISIAEYFLLDMIYRISGNGSRFAQKKLENIAFDMNMSKKGVILMRDRLLEKKLLIKGTGNRLRTSEKVHKVYFLDTSENKKVHFIPKKEHKVPQNSVLYSSKTSVENNPRLTENNKELRILNKYGMETIASAEARLKATAAPNPNAWVSRGASK